MKNVVYFEPDLNAVLLVNEEQVGNSIILHITTDDAENQKLGIMKDQTALDDIDLESDAENVVELASTAWALGKITTIGLFKGESEDPVATAAFRFPEILNTDSTLSGGNGVYTMQGSSSTDYLLEQLQEQILTLSAQAVEYILPESIDVSTISDGSTHSILTFEFESKQEDEKVSFYAQMTYDIETAVDAVNEIYTDCNITVTYKVDGQTLGISHQTYGDGDKILTLNYLLSNFPIGNHSFVVQITVDGGALGTENFQMISAYLLAAAAVADGYADEYDITDESWSGDGEFYPDVLPEGLDNEDLSEEAHESGEAEGLIKYALGAAGSDESGNVQSLSEFFNTKYMLCVGQHYFEPFYRVNGYYRKDGTHGMEDGTGGKIGRTSGTFYIPIKRITGYHFFKFKAKIIKNNGLNHGVDFNNLSAGVAYVDSGGIMRSVASPLTTNVTEWTEFSVGISTIPYVDYIVFKGSDGSPAYKDMYFVR